MLKIRLSRGGKHKSPFFRIVLTEHTKSAKSGYKEVLGWFDPINHKIEVDIEKAKKLIENGVQPTERVAKLMYQVSKDDLFKKYYEEKNIVRKKKNAPEEEETPVTEAPSPQETPTKEEKEAPVEEIKEEISVEETKEETPAKENTPTEEAKEEEEKTEE